MMDPRMRGEQLGTTGGNGGSGGSGDDGPKWYNDVLAQGRGIADNFWNGYGQNAANNYQQLGYDAQLRGQDAQYQQNLLAQRSQATGDIYSQALAETGNNYGTALANSGNQYASQINAAGEMYAGHLGTQGEAAKAGGLGYAQQIGQVGQQQSAALQNQANALNQAAAGAQNRSVGPMNFGAQNQALGASQQAAGQLAGIEATQGPSAAQAQLQSALNQTQASNLAMARSGRGFGGSASAMRQASQQNAAAGQQAANQSAMLRAQEDAAFRQRQAANLGAAAGIQQGAAGQFGQQAGADMQARLQQQQQNDALMSSLYGQGGNLLAQGANTALQGATSSAGTAQNAYAQQLAAAGQAAQLGMGAQQAAASTALGARQAGGNMVMSGYGQAGQMGLAGLGQAGNQMAQGYNQALQGTTTNLAAQQAAGGVYGQGLAAQQQAEQNYLQAVGIDQGVATANQQANMQLAGAGIGAGGALLAALPLLFSDERVKTDIEPATLDLIDKAPGYTYRYKDEAHGKGKFLGPMAQDLEKSELGASMVVTGPDGLKRVDTGRAGLAALGGLSALKRSFDSELKRLEAEIDRLGKRKAA